MLRQNIKIQSRSKSKSQKGQTSLSKLDNKTFRSSQSTLKMNQTSEIKEASLNAKQKSNLITGKLSSQSKNKDIKLSKQESKITISQNTKPKIGVNTTIRKRIQSNNQNIHPNIIQSNTAKLETKTIRDVRLSNTQNQNKQNSLNKQLKIATLGNRVPSTTNLMTSKLNKSISKSKQNKLLTNTDRINQEKLSKNKQPHKYTVSNSKSKRELPTSFKHLQIPKIKISPAHRYTQSQQQQDSLLMYIPPSIIIQHLKLSITDFRFIAVTQQQQYFKDVLAQHLKTNALFTIRIIDKNVIKKQQIEEQLIQSLTIHLFLNNLNFNHIQTLYTIFSDANSLYLLLQPMMVSKSDNPKLSEVVTNNSTLNQPKLALHIKELMTTLYQLHNNNIILRDMNIQFLRVQFGVLKITLIDCLANLTNRSLRDSFLGDICKMPQELALGKSYERPYDLWNAGIILYTLVTGNRPFSSLSLIQEIDYRIPLNTSKDLNDLICHLLVESRNRFTAKEALNHPFLQKIQQTMIHHELWRICQNQ